MQFQLICHSVSDPFKDQFNSNFDAQDILLRRGVKVEWINSFQVNFHVQFCLYNFTSGQCDLILTVNKSGSKGRRGCT